MNGLLDYLALASILVIFLTPYILSRLQAVSRPPQTPVEKQVEDINSTLF